MQLPEDLQHFPSTTLLVTSDTVSAKFWLIGGDAMDELDGVSLPHETNEGSERPPLSSDGTRLGGSDTPDDGPRFQHYIHDLVERITHLTREHTIAHIYLVMPAKVEHALSADLPNDIAPLIVKRLHADLMQESPLEIIRRARAA